MCIPSQVPRLAVDIGGTFTDVAIDTGHDILSAKTLTSHDNPVDGVLRGIAFACEGANLQPEEFGSVLHGTTLATNALIERRGARVAVITTEGFRDILEIANERRYDQYDINIDAPDYLVRRDMIFTVPERMAADGTVLTPLTPFAAELAIRAALAAGADSLAICFLHSYRDPTHEQMMARVAARIAPDLSVSLSSDVSPEIREFDRMCTTVCNAYVKPLMARYLSDLARAIKDAGYRCPLYIVTSCGGMTTLDTAMTFPIRLVESGPSGGAIMAASVARARGLDQVLSFDMGGTTAKLCLIEEQSPSSSRIFEIDRAARFLKGSGIPVRIPVIDMIEIGAGGGSIARVDKMGRLRVGPHSASSTPGPACYGRGGDAPTVTDADVAIGYIDPRGFAENRLTLDPARSRSAIQRDVADPLDMDVAAGADGISRTVDEAMANAARMHAAEQGKDLQGYTMIAFGGNGPLHAARIAQKLGISRIVIPPNPSVGSAVGFLDAPVSYELVRTFAATSAVFPFDDINAMLADIENRAVAVVTPGAMGQAVSVQRRAFLRYAGQGQEIEVGVPDGPLTPAHLDHMVARFGAEYRRQFARVVPGMTVEWINWAVTASTETGSVAHIPTTPNASTAPQPVATRPLHIGEGGQEIQAHVYRRADLRPGDRCAGPALIAEPQTTTWVPSGFDLDVDGGGGLVLTRRAAPRAPRTRADSAIDLQVMWDRLLAVVEEQGQVLLRTAFSAIVRECEDISAGIFDTSGNMLAQAVTGTPGHINTMAETVKSVLPWLDLSSMAPGDIFVTNDPWIGAGHLNDIMLVAPVFCNGRLVAYSACTSHVYDLGGRGMGPDGADIFDEGLFIPVCKLADKGLVNDLVIQFIKANSRSPMENEGDLYALMACCDVAAARLVDMMHEFGLADLDRLAQHILDTTGRATRAAIARLPQGNYAHELMIDGYDFEIKLRATMTIETARILVDFKGSSGPSALGINCPLNYAAAYTCYALRCIIGPDVPNTAASLAPFVVTAPPGCIVNAQPPAPVAMRHTVGQMTADVVLGALSRALPDRIPAEGATCLWDLPLRSATRTGPDASGYTVFATEFCHAGGTGARPTKDGLSATAFPSGILGTPTEIAETTAPVRYLRRELIPDSGGAGQFRGGLGQRIDLTSSEDANILLLAGVERTRFAARGRAGGGNGTKGRIHLASGPQLRGKGEQIIPAGDVLIWESPGGAGFGDPLLRDPETVARDVREGVVTARAARHIYRVVLTDTGAVDGAATRALRDEADG